MNSIEVLESIITFSIIITSLFEVKVKLFKHLRFFFYFFTFFIFEFVNRRVVNILDSVNRNDCHHSFIKAETVIVTAEQTFLILVESNIPSELESIRLQKLILVFYSLDSSENMV